jgi:endonuclease YncB( thermonuclease family)
VLCDVGFQITVNVDVRLAGINAAELATPAGKAARDHLSALAPVGAAVTVTCFGPDKYGSRYDASLVTTAGVDVARQMIADGFAAAWDGKGVKPVPTWPPVPTPTQKENL